ncbi:hypothetical protein XBFFR1_200021 [Xenorhabdus bovienii str. feltiae France]|nr:hypothetical protein XBFFR1_200021 [Xenorhabdus bovienii str. feltiae France]
MLFGRGIEWAVKISTRLYRATNTIKPLTTTTYQELNDG